MKLKKKYLIPCSLIVVAAIGICIILSLHHKDYIKVNNLKVQKDEFDLIANSNISKISALYSQKNKNTVNNNDLWDLEINGITAREELVNESVNQLVDYKIIEYLYKKEGLGEEFQYNKFLSDLKEENAKRALDKKEGKTVYGTLSYDSYTYYTYLSDQKKIALKNLFVKNLEEPSEEKLKEYYESNKETKYKNDVELNVQFALFKYLDSENNYNEELQKECLKQSTMCKKDMDNGMSIEDLKKKYGKYGSIGTRVFNSMKDIASADKWDSFQILYDTALDLESGKTSDLMNDRNMYIIVRCVDKEYDKISKYEDVKNIVLTDYQNSLFEQWIQKEKENANIKILDNVKKWRLV